MKIVFYNNGDMEEQEKKTEQPKEKKGRNTRKIIGIIAIIGLVIDIIILIIFLLLRFRTKPAPTSSEDKTSEYMESAEGFKTKLLNMMNYSIDHDLYKTDAQYDMEGIISITTNDTNEVSFTGFNDNYVVTMNIRLGSLDNFIDKINKNDYIETSISFYDNDGVSSNPLADDTDFNNGQRKNVKHKLAVTNPTFRGLSATFLDNSDGMYYSITNYQYEIGEFHFNQITSNHMTGYSLDTSPVMYYLLQSL